MTEHNLTAEAVARFLSDHPDFFEDHADVFAAVRVPHPHQTQAISLGERQIMVLRDRLKAHEARLASLLHHAERNDRINDALMQWSAHLLAEPEARALPTRITQDLQALFELNGIALRLWASLPPDSDARAQPVSPETRQWAETLAAPHCGPVDASEQATWLPASTASMACLALRNPASDAVIGLLVFGSDDAQRFTPDMGALFLERIALLAGAALSRLADTTAGPDPETDP